MPANPVILMNEADEKSPVDPLTSPTDSNSAEAGSTDTTPAEGTTTESDPSAESATPKREKTPAQKAAASRKRARRMAKMRPAQEVAEALYERFPKAFIRESRERKPLVIGIHVALAESVGDDFHKLEQQRFLNNYAHSLGYLHSVADKRERIRLDGTTSGEEITDEMAAEARKEIDAIQEKRAARGDAPKRGPIGAKKPGARKERPAGTDKGRRGGFLGGPRNRKRPVEGSAEELKDSVMRNQRSAKIIEKKRRIVTSPGNTLLGQKLADAGLTGAAPRKKLRLGKKSDD